MTTPTATPYHWIKSVPSAVLQKNRTPQIGFPPEFPWEQFSAKLAETFQLQDLTIKPSTAFESREGEGLLTGIGDRAVPLNFSIAPLSGSVCWLFAEADVSLLMSLLLGQRDEALTSLDPDFKTAFYQFLAIETLTAFQSLDFDHELTPHMQKNSALPTGSSLCLDIIIALKQKTLQGRLVFSGELLKSFQERYSQRTRLPHTAYEIETCVHLEAGRLSMRLSEWKKVESGDFLILDSCSLKPSGEGRIMLTIDGYQCFRAKVKDGNIKILEHPLYHEAETPMEPRTPSDDESEKLDLDYPLYESIGEEEIEAKEEIAESGFEPLPPLQSDTLYEPVEGLAKEEAISPGEVSPEAPKEKKPFTPEEITVDVVVEVGRLQMTVGKLMELQPGAVLDLNVHPENGVDLVVNGKCVAKGELLLVGNTLGVRVLDIG